MNLLSGRVEEGESAFESLQHQAMTQAAVTNGQLLLIQLFHDGADDTRAGKDHVTEPEALRVANGADVDTETIIQLRTGAEGELRTAPTRVEHHDAALTDAEARLDGEVRKSALVLMRLVTDCAMLDINLRQDERSVTMRRRDLEDLMKSAAVQGETIDKVVAATRGNSLFKSLSVSS